MEKWVEIRKSGNFEELGKKAGVSPVIARLLINRNISEDEIHAFFHAGLDDMYDAHLMKDVDKACEIISNKLCEGKRIRVIGDYDIDGVCSAYILEKTLKELSLAFAVTSVIDSVLPHRIYDGYGLNKKLVKAAYDEGVDTIITCDNGISALDEIEYAKELGMTVIVTDHHEIPYKIADGKKLYELPAADAVINPHQKDCAYPFKPICGAVVAYKLSLALYEKCDMAPDREKFLDIAAFATIGDVMELRGENRIIVKYGLRLLSNTKNVGMRALIKITGLENKAIQNGHVGFILGPCINAPGRIESAMKALELLRCEDEAAALELAAQLSAINESRKQMTSEWTEKACKILDDMESIPHVIVIYLCGCHESIAGIIAGKLREKYTHPAIVLTDAEDGLKGSGRSIEKYNMFEALSRVKDMFSKFGGHALAAGLSIEAKSNDTAAKEELVRLLSDRLNSESGLAEEDFAEKVEFDMVLPFNYINENLIRQLDMLEPCGNGNRKPLFAQRDVIFENGRILGKNRNTYKAAATDSSGARVEAVVFGNADEISNIVASRESMLITYVPEVNEYANSCTLQLRIKGIR